MASTLLSLWLPIAVLYGPPKRFDSERLDSTTCEARKGTLLNHPLSPPSLPSIKFTSRNGLEHERRGVLRDEVIFLYKLAQSSKEAFFRRIEFYDEERDRVLVFLTNHLELAAATVAAIYKERWQIELFSRARHGALLRMLWNFKN
jgi:hypothetical protein